MGNIIHPISEQEISEQIAVLLNTYNDLSYKRTFSDILQGKVKYIAETHGKRVLAACGYEHLSYQLSEIKHLVVHPNWRGKGLGRFMVKRCIEIIQTPLLYATVKRVNNSSINVFKSLGFKEACTYFNEEHDVIMLTRSSSKWTQKPNWKSVSLVDPENLGQGVSSSST